MGCFAMVCGKELQNVTRRKLELKGKGNLKRNTARIPFQWHAEHRLWSSAENAVGWTSLSMEPQTPSTDKLPKL